MEIFKDLKGSEALNNSCVGLLKQLENFEKKQFEQWVQKVKEEIKVKDLT